MLALGLWAFLLFGGLLVIVGASLDAIERAFALDLTRSGLLGASVSLGIGLGVLIAGPLVDRLPRRPLFLLATLLAAGALGTVSSEMGFERLVAHVALAGLGAGLYETLLNTATVETYLERAVRPMFLIHAAATLGAGAAPPLIGWLATHGDWTLAFRVLGASFVSLSIASFAVPWPHPSADRRGGRRAFGSLLRDPGLLALCAVGFAYVGLETSFTLFAVPYAGEGLGLDPARGRSAISAFWLGLLAGRLALLVLHTADARPIAVAGLSAAAIAGVGTLTGWTSIELLLGAIGVALGGIFPLMVTLAGQRNALARGSAVGLVLGSAALGGFVVPWLTGFLGDRIGIVDAVRSLSLWCLWVGAAAAWLAVDARRRRASKAEPVQGP